MTVQSPSLVAARIALALLALLVLAPSAEAQDETREGAGAAVGGAHRPAGDSPNTGSRARAETRGTDAVTPRLVAESEAHLTRLEGLPIVAVSVEIVGERFREAAPKVASVEIGEPLLPNAARRAMNEVLATGRFAQAQADARPYRDGAILRILAVPRRLVAGIDVSGVDVDAERLLRAAELSDGSEITDATLEEKRGAIITYLRRLGYDAAKITIDTRDTDDDLEVLLSIEVEPGDRSTITRRIFVIEPRFDRVLGDLKHDYEVEAGDPIDEDALVEADNDMVERLREAKFFDAQVSHRVLRRGTDAFLYIYLETGPRYRVVFRGNRRRDDEDLTEALALEELGADTSSESVAETLEKWYRDRGFLDARVRAEAVSLEEGAVVELRFRIDEGKVVRVVRRFFTCLPAEPPEGLSADDLSEEIDAVLEENMPDMPLFHAVDEEVTDGAFFTRGGSRADARVLAPALTYTPEAYEKAVEHLEALLESKGYLDAEVGPVGLVRARCDPRSRGGECVPLALPPIPPSSCASDGRGLPVAEPELPDGLTCVPDPARSVHCASELVIHMPIQLGPRMTLYDVVFEGNEQLGTAVLQTLAAFPLGTPFSNIELDAARGRLVKAYKDLGYAYATVRTEVDYSPDRTRARARFIINEHEPVVIDGYEVRGAVRTDPDLILSRLSLCTELSECTEKERYYRQNLVRDSEEQIATLGTFSSVTIALEDPEVPQGRKRVIITVSELAPQYLEPSGGFYTGEGLRLGLEYGHRNIGGRAIAFTLRAQASILPEFLILDAGVRENYAQLTLAERIEFRLTGTVRIPEIGLGPKVDLVINGVGARDLQRDYSLLRGAALPVLSYRPVRQVNLQLGATAEVNDVTLFAADNVESAIVANPSLANLLRVPDGNTVAFSQRVSATWDRRDRPLSATRGTYTTAAVEHVTAVPLNSATEFNSEFLKFTGRFGGYIPLGGDWAIALSVAAGYNLQLTSQSRTYPDRRFYLGGVNTIRGFLLDSVVPEDIAERVRAGEIAIDQVGPRGGDVFWSPRAELRIPLTDLFSIGVFLDAGNVWSNPGSIQSVGDFFTLRYAAGGGLRMQTPFGPVAFDYGFNLLRNDWEDLGALAFSIGLF